MPTPATIPLRPAGAEPFKIETGIPVPRRTRAGPVTSALRELAQAPVGSSMFVPGLKPGRIGAYVASAGLGLGWCVSRTEGDGARVWKLSEPTVRGKAKA